MNDYPHILVSNGFGGQIGIPQFILQANLENFVADFEAQAGDEFIGKTGKNPTDHLEDFV